MTLLFVNQPVADGPGSDLRSRAYGECVEDYLVDWHRLAGCPYGVCLIAGQAGPRPLQRGGAAPAAGGRRPPDPCLAHAPP